MQLGKLLALLLLTFTLMSCNKSATHNSDSDSGNGTVQAATQELAAVPDAAAGQAAAEPAVLDSASTDDAKAHELGSCREFCAQCGNSRGKYTAPPRDEPIQININFTGVHYNDASDANMSKLDFELVGLWKNRERMRTHLSMDDRLQDSFPAMQTALCSLQVQPVLSNTVETAIRQRGPEDYKTYGAYTVTVTDAKGELVGEFPLDGKGQAGEAQWQNTKESKYHVGKTFKRDTDEWRFDIRRMAEFREQKYEAQVLFGLVFQSGGEITQETKGPDGSLHEYRFPMAAVDIYTPEAIHAGERAQMEREKHERPVKYAGGDLPPENLQPIFVSTTPQPPSAGGGGGSPPSYGCDGGG